MDEVIMRVSSTRKLEKIRNTIKEIRTANWLNLGGSSPQTTPLQSSRRITIFGSDRLPLAKRKHILGSG